MRSLLFLSKSCILFLLKNKGADNMQELKVKNNKTGLKIYINGTPDLKQVPKQEMDLIAVSLELAIISIMEQERVNNKPP